MVVILVEKLTIENEKLNVTHGLQMPLTNDPKDLILRLFEMEEREGQGSHCGRFPEGIRAADIPLEDEEKVFGIYKNKYYFTPKALIIRDKATAQRINWSDISSCSTQHGEGETFSDLALVDGRFVRVRVGDMATGWSGRISQLYHRMIERYGRHAALGTPLMPMKEFFAKVTDDYSIAPNLEPHPSLTSFMAALGTFEKTRDGTRVLMDIVQDSEEESPVAVGVVVVTPKPSKHFQRFVETFHADGVIPADDNTIRKAGNVPEGFNVWHIPWD